MIAKETASIIRENPGPEVAVMALTPGPGGADEGAGGGNLVFHLDKPASHLGQTLGGLFHDLRSRE